MTDSKSALQNPDDLVLRIADEDDTLTASTSSVGAYGTVGDIRDYDSTTVEIPSYASWEGVLTLEGVESGDGRLFALGSLDWDTPPIPLMYQPANIGGHNGSVLVGQITNVARKSNQLYGWGIIDLKARYNGEEIGKEVYRLMSEEFLNGVSVDVDKVKDADVEQIFGTAVGEKTQFGKPVMTIFHRGRVRGATLVAFPAFTEAKVYLTGDVLTASAVGLILTSADLSAEDLDADCGCALPAAESAHTDASNGVITASGHTITIPDLPKAEWFNEPTDVALSGAFTITDQGRVYGLLAPANTTHRAVKTKVPVHNVDYSRFMGRETIVEGGGRVVTGVITMNCGHAPTQNYGTLENRIDHYDNSCSVVADVRIGHTADGSVWIAGALKHFVSAEQVSTMMSCTLSGDWQPHPDRPGVREFIAALLVPVPGFPMARTAASVVYEDGTLTASAVPVIMADDYDFDAEMADSRQYLAEREAAEAELLTAAARKKNIFAQRLGLDAASRKLALALRIGRAGRDV